MRVSGTRDDQLKALGMLTAEFSRLESTIAALAWQLSRDPTSALVFITHLSFTRLCQATAALTKEKTRTMPAVAEELEQIIGRALRSASDRNRLIHSIWVAEAPGTPLSRIRITAGDRLDIQLEMNVPAEKIHHIVDEIEQTRKEVDLFMEKLTELKLWPRPRGGEA